MARTAITCARCKRKIGASEQFIRLAEKVMASGAGYADTLEVVDEIDLCIYCAEICTNAVSQAISDYGSQKRRKMAQESGAGPR